MEPFILKINFQSCKSGCSNVNCFTKTEWFPAFIW